MIYFGFVELIEKFIEWLKQYAEPINPVFYWANVFISAIPLALGFYIWEQAGLGKAQPFLVFGGAYGLIISISFGFIAGWKNRQWEEKKK